MFDFNAAEDDLPSSIWQLGIYDAHCHPTDNYKRLAAALDIIHISKLTIMATRLDDQVKVHDAATQYPERIVPSFGYHPWFTHLLYTSQSPPESKYLHYRSVLLPEPPKEFLDLLPDPVSLSSFIEILTENIETHKHALVGEIGIDRSFRLPKSGKLISFEESDTDDSSSISSDVANGHNSGDTKKLSPYRVKQEHQTEVLLAQLRVAAKFRRPVSVHGVQAHGVLYEIFSQLWTGYSIPTRRQKKKEKEEQKFVKVDMEGGTAQSDNDPLPFPGRICLHSYSGPPDQIKLWTNRKLPVTVYFSFSILVNSRYGDKFKQVLRAVPDDRLLVESDFHMAGKTMQALLAEIVKFVCEVKGWEIEQGVRILGTNWRRFVYGTDDL
ncbi:hypothetical protein V1520DRAFT_336566 [Lipomyces starkeyi]|uniref:Metallo-dependent hydrolase n=1 Tax=Lipomyces starkeyi NRRL Y-11557 TaxID=675824 RepID=A0A1E3QDT6_LIPST|nr:hypothetical protein LIPSTDRAFT_1256 [Lipomyces starkeyi NRRL Y-11557]